MAVSYHLFLKGLSGKLGLITFRTTTKGGTVVSRTITENHSRSEKQQLQRLQFGNISAVYSLIKNYLRNTFETMAQGQSLYNAFMSVNLKSNVKVFLSKTAKQHGAALLAPYCISMGSLPSITVQRNAQGRYVSNVCLGVLAIDADTTVGQFARAVVCHNESFEYGDSISFLLGKQLYNADLDIPVASVCHHKVVLNPDDSSPLWSVVEPYGFQNDNHYLSTMMDLPEGALAWIHWREGLSLQVSSQHLVMTSDMYMDYTDSDAFHASARSYGGTTNTSPTDCNDLGADCTSLAEGNCPSPTPLGTARAIAEPLYDAPTECLIATAVMCADAIMPIQDSQSPSVHPPAASELTEAPLSHHACTGSDGAVQEPVSPTALVQQSMNSRAYT